MKINAQDEAETPLGNQLLQEKRIHQNPQAMKVSSVYTVMGSSLRTQETNVRSASAGVTKTGHLVAKTVLHLHATFV
jgi:hypothetical protein